MIPKYQFVVVASARWETEWIAEWLSYYREIGFDHAYIYCNDDEPEDLFRALIPFVHGNAPFVTFHHHGIQGVQEQCFTHFLRNHVNDCSWFSFFDIDEFLLLRHHDTIAEFMRSLPTAADAVHFNSLNAGYNGHVERPSGLAVKLFNRRETKVGGFTKFVARTDAFAPDQLVAAFAAGWLHNAALLLKPHSRNVNVLGMDMTSYYDDVHNNWVKHSIDTVGFHESLIDIAFLYHIPMKSEGDMLRRLKRGVGGDQACQEVWQAFVDKGPDAVRARLATPNEVLETRLTDIWAKIEARARVGQIAPGPPGENLAKNCEALQSSISEYSTYLDPAKDAEGVVNGKPTGRHHHCTSVEMNPWWQVKLRGAAFISEIRVYNRVDFLRGRLRNFTLKSSLDGEVWETLSEKFDGQPFGGVDGQYFCWRPAATHEARFIMICGVGECALDLDQVEVY